MGRFRIKSFWPVWRSAFFAAAAFAPFPAFSEGEQTDFSPEPPYYEKWEAAEPAARSRYEEGVLETGEFQPLEEDPLGLQSMLEKRSRQKLWFQAMIFNDNLGSKGNEIGLSHGSRFTVSRGPSEESEWRAALNSQLYLESLYIIEAGERASVHAVERNDFSFEKKIRRQNGEYIVLGALMGWTTSNPDYFLPLVGAKWQQKTFHDLFSPLSDDIMKYTYDQKCYQNLEAAYQKGLTTLDACAALESGGASDLLEDRSVCSNLTGVTRGALQSAYKRGKERCESRAEFHIGGKAGLGKIFRLGEIRDLCPPPRSESKAKRPLSCISYFQLEGGFDLITVKNESAIYLFAKASYPMFRAGRDSVFSAFGQIGHRQVFDDEDLEKTLVLGLLMSSEKFRARIEVMQPKNSSGKLLEVLNDDDSIVFLSFEFAFH